MGALPSTLYGFMVRKLYRDCLFREVDPGGYTSGVNMLTANGGNLTQLMAAIQDSPEGIDCIEGEHGVFVQAASALGHDVSKPHWATELIYQERAKINALVVTRGVTAASTAAFIEARTAA